MNNTLKNGFMVLEYLAATGKTHSVKELADIFNLPNSHVCRLLKTLTEIGYITQDKSRKYFVSMKILNLGNACLTQFSLRHTVRPYLEEFNSKTGLNSYLSIPVNGQAMIIDVIHAKGSKRDPSLDIGAFNNYYSSACGKLCAAYASHNELKNIMSGKRKAFTPKTIIKESDLKKEYSLIRKKGMSIADSEASVGTFAFAFPVYNSEGNFCGGLGAYERNINTQRQEELLNVMRETAISASLALGYTMK